jgi:N-methylhydantoinase B/oxoprolinase/acetone carboxylase alpha subunit
MEAGLAPGGRVIIETAGGGGYGNPELRAPLARAADIADEKASPHPTSTTPRN